MTSIEGCDFSANAIPSAELRAAGKRFASRYLAHDWRGITWSEVQDLRTGGIQIVSNFEAEADRFLAGFQGGADDARYAWGILDEVGLPHLQPIYFSCDFDATPAQQAVINAYLDGVASVIGLDRTGMYAGYYPLMRAFDAGKIAWGWQTYAWSGGLWEPRAQLQQYDIYGESVAGTDVDLDRALVDHYGQASDFWAQPTTTPAPTTTPPPIPAPPTYPIQRQPILSPGTVAFKGNRLPFRSVDVTARSPIEAWCIHGTRIRAYPHRGAPAATNSQDAKRGHRYKFRYQTVIGGEAWLAGAGGSFVLATAFDATEPESAGKE